jgi:cytochrome c peroxidase
VAFSHDGGRPADAGYATIAPAPMRRLAPLLALPLTVVALFAFRARQEAVPTLPATLYDYDGIALPRHLTAPPIQALDNTPAANPVTDAGATLGRVLFYDIRLSRNETVSCASCHQQGAAFSDNVALSRGFDGGHTGRNSMGLSFARYYERGRFFWDERAATLEAQVLMPIQDGVEMGMTLPEVVTRLQAAGFYGPLFRNAFGTDAITSERVARALAQFVRSMVAPGSRYDQGRAAAPPSPPGAPLATLTASENNGLALFFGRALCSRCHTGDLMVLPNPRNNGLDAVTGDAGAGGGRFKTGSLRNVALTAPFMHDGRFQTLQQVVDFYDRGVQPNPDLDPALRTPDGRPIRLNLSPQERADLVAFLGALTDTGFLNDVRWSNPFVTRTAAAPVATAEAPTLTLAGPNPFSGTTTLRVTLPASASATLAVYDLHGRHVATLTEGLRPASTFTAVWDAAGLAAGVYLARLEAGGTVITRPLTVW